jgi:hypothetical protein
MSSWWAGVLFVAAVILGVASPGLALADVVPAPEDDDAVAAAGLVVMVLGSAAVLAA